MAPVMVREVMPVDGAAGGDTAAVPVGAEGIAEDLLIEKQATDFFPAPHLLSCCMRQSRPQDWDCIVQQEALNSPGLYGKS